MNVFLTYTVIGVVVGATYAITASGLVVTYVTSGVFNFAHGAIGMIAAFTYWELTVDHHMPPLFAVALVLLVEAPLMGMLVEKVFMRRLAGASAERPLMVTLGLLLILLGVAQSVWGNQTQRYVPAFFQAGIPFTGERYLRIVDVNLNGEQLVTLLVAILVAVGLWFFLHKTRIGVAMRAVVDSPELLGMAGASPTRVASMGWVTGAVLASLAGILLAAKVQPLDITTITLIVVNGYAAAVVGKLKNLPMTFLGGMLLGLMESYAVGYLPQSWQSSWLSNMQLALPMIFLFVVLLLLPHEPLRVAAQLRRPVPRILSLGESAIGAGGAIAAASVAAAMLSGTALQTVSTGLAFGLVALSLVLLTGYGGQVCLAQLTFAGVGAFAMSRVAGGGSWWGVVAATGATATIGAIVAIPTVRLRGIYLALSTLAFAQFATYAFFQNGNVFGAGGAAKVGRLGILGVGLAGNRVELVVVAVAFAIAGAGVIAVRRSIIGRRMVALADSPAAAATVGLGAYSTRLALFAMSAGLAGFGGAMLGGVSGLVGSNDFGLVGSMTLLLMLTIWGVRSIGGALLAGLTYAVLPVLASHLHSVTDLVGLVTGAGIIGIGRLPNGVLGTEAARKLYPAWVRSRFGWDNRVPPKPVPELPMASVEAPAGEQVAIGAGCTPVLEATGLTVNFGGITALDSVSLAVVPGQVTGLIGPNGAGKTTLFNALTGLLHPEAGWVKIAGRDVTSLGPHRRARLGMARTFQRLELFWSLSAGDNVRVAAESGSRVARRARLQKSSRVARRARLQKSSRVARRARLQKSSRVARRARLQKSSRVARRARLQKSSRVARRARLQKSSLAGLAGGSIFSARGEVTRKTAGRLLSRVGLPDLSSEPAGVLSTGTARLVEVARSLAAEPKIILLDEPGSGLDESESAALGRLLRDIAAGGIGVLLVEHDVGLVMSTCSFIYVLDFGRVIAAGTPEEIANHPDVQTAYLGKVAVS